MELRERLMELGFSGFECSQMMMAVALEMDGQDNPDLIRAMSGLTGGMGHSGGVCGAPDRRLLCSGPSYRERGSGRDGAQ